MRMDFPLTHVLLYVRSAVSFIDFTKQGIIPVRVHVHLRVRVHVRVHVHVRVRDLPIVQRK